MSYKMLKFHLLIVVVMTSLSCSFTKKVKDGETAYALKQYMVAIELLESEFNEGAPQGKARKAYLLGKSYNAISDYNNSIIWMKTALSFDYNPLAYKELGLWYKYLEDYDNAIKAFEEYAFRTNNKSEAEREIRICREVSEWIGQPSAFSVDRLLENSFSSDYNPVIYERDFLLFTSDRPTASGSDTYKWTGEKYSDFFIMLKTGSEVRRFDALINSEHNEGAGCFTKDFDKFYFTRCFSQDNNNASCKIMESVRIGGFFTEPVTLTFVKENINYGHPALFEQDSVLIFSTDLGDPGVSYDLYYSELNEEGTWSEPEPLPSIINTPGNEKFPTVQDDTLYYSSDYLPGLGGLDIFKTYLKPDRSWAAPVNMKPPINSGGDDFGLIVDKDARLTGNMLQKGYFSSSRRGSAKDDIYIYTKRPLPKAPKPEVVSESEPKTGRTLYLAGRTFENQYLKDEDPSSGVSGQRILPLANLRIADSDGNIVLQSNSGPNGIFATEISENQSYSIIANKSGYLTRGVNLTTDNINWKEGELSQTINVDILLQKIFKDKEITLENIYYEYDKWDITPDAKPTLDELAELLKVNPNIKIQLSSHTDCRGDSLYNQILSQKRAQSAVDYLISKGIETTRLIAKGFGKDKLLIECECSKCTEIEHQLNRRTAFRILE